MAGAPSKPFSRQFWRSMKYLLCKGEHKTGQAFVLMALVSVSLVSIEKFCSRVRCCLGVRGGSLVTEKEKTLFVIQVNLKSNVSLPCGQAQ